MQLEEKNKIKKQILKIKEDDDGIRLDRWFKRHYPDISFIKVAKFIRKGQVLINKKKATISSRLLKNQEIIFPNFIINLNEKYKNTNKENDMSSKGYKYNPLKEKVPFNNLSGYLQSIISNLKKNIIYYDDNIIVISKPAGLATQGGSDVNVCIDDLSDYIKINAEDQKPKLVHRLDKETSGIIILARSARSAAKMSELIRNKAISKKYLAIVDGVPVKAHGTINIPIEKYVDNEVGARSVKNIKDAITKYKVIDKTAENCIVEFELYTGRTHQIRIHSAAIGCPIIGDRKYSNSRYISNLSGLNSSNNNVKNNNTNNIIDNNYINVKKNFRYIKHMYLHSYYVEFELDNKKIKLTAKLPDYFLDKVNEYGFRY